MSLVTNLQSLATRIATEFKTVYAEIGTLTALTTTAKGNLVAAINEVNAKPSGSGGAAIDDATTTTTTVWSSSKTNTAIGSAVSGLVGSAPATLDTLNELASALGNDANFATTMTTALGNRVRFDAAQTLTAPQITQALANIGAAAASHTHTASAISDSTAVGRSVLTAVDAPAARTAIGAGTSNLVIGTTASTAKAGDYQPTAANISDSTTVGRAVLTAIDAPAARTAIGAGTSNLAIGTTSTTAKAGDYQPAAANISDSTTVGRAVLVAVDAAAARTAIGAGTGNSNLVIGTTSTTAKAGDYQPTAANISDSTAVGRSVLTAIDAAAARTAIGAGTGNSNLVIGTTSTTAKAGDYQPTAANISDSTATGRAVLTAVDAAAARAATGAGTSNLVLGTTTGTAADAATVGDTTTDFVATFVAGLA